MSSYCYKENYLNYAMYLSAFLIPFLLSHITLFPIQILIGIFVNFLIARFAKTQNLFITLPILIVPAIATLFSGIVFNAYTGYLIYLIPAIWLGNYLYFILVKNSLIKASFIKAITIGTVTLILFMLNLVPVILLIPMSLIQLVTAIIGGLIANNTIYVQKQKFSS